MLNSGRRGYRVSRIFLFFLWMVLLVISLSLISLFTTFFSGSPAQNLTSLDWSGYVVNSDSRNPQPVLANVSGSWTVPTVNLSPQDTFSAAWVGIGGQQDETLIQAGTEHDSIGGVADYSAWYELLPNDSVTITTMNVSAGDVITASLNLADSAANTWSIEMVDVTTGQRFQQIFYYVSSRLSAEWIVERPTVDHNIAALADFGSITFTDASASTDAAVGTITDFSYSAVTMTDRQNRPLVSVSSPTSKGSSFTVSFLGSTAAATAQSRSSQPFEGKIVIAPATRKQFLDLM